MAETMATARSNNIVPVLAFQDVHQLYTRYAKEEADAILNIAGNVVCGQAAGQTSLWMSEKFPKVQREKMSVSTNSKDTSINQALQWEPMVTAATIANLSSGEFVGVVADDPDMIMELKAFHAKLRREESADTENSSLPMVAPFSGDALRAEVHRVYDQVKWDIKALINGELRRMMADDDLIGLIVKGGKNDE